jgi:hypothetical protein
MALEIKKTNRETSQNLVRRFSRRVKQSGILVQARKNRFRAKKKSGQTEKRAALRREQLREEYRKLEKLGQVKKTKRRR